MATTNAERQAAYRAKHLKDVDGVDVRLNIVVHATAKAALKRLSARYGVTQKAMLENLLRDAESVAIDAAGAETSEYYAGELCRPVVKQGDHSGVYRFGSMIIT